MMQTSRLRDQLYTAAAVALLLTTSLLNGYITVAFALVLLVVGLLLFPKMRRAGIVSALVAAGVAVLVVLLRPLL